MVSIHAHADGAKATKCKIDIVRAAAHSEQRTGLTHFFERRLVTCDSAHHHVRMPNDVFRGGLDGDVHSFGQRFAKISTAPGVVSQNDYVARMRCLNDGGQILYVESL